MVPFFGCQEADEVTIEEPLQRIKSVTICCNSEGESLLFTFLYEESNKLGEIHLNDHVLAKYSYANEQLSQIEFIGNDRGTVSRVLLFKYDGEKVASVVRSDVDRLPGIRLNTISRQYDHHSDVSFSRTDRDTFYSLSPPIIAVRHHEVKSNYQRYSFFDIQGMDTIRSGMQQTEVILDNTFPNPLRKLEFPVGFNEYATMPFSLTSYTIPVQEIFFTSAHLPYQISRSDNGALWLTTKFKYTLEEDRLVEIEVTTNDLIEEQRHTSINTLEWEVVPQ